MKKILTAENIVGQDLLRQVETLCVQEEPPACSTACPLHLDIRKFTALIRDGKMAEAYTLYAKTIPFAPIIARTCSAPCQQVCKRKALGGSVQIAELENTIAALANKATKPPFMLPKKTGKVAIVGASLRGLAAANDLARKGYGVTVLEACSKAGGSLRHFSEEILPAEVLKKELDCLQELKVKFQYDTVVDAASANGIANLFAEDYGAVYFACKSYLDKEADSETLLTSQKNVVAGRRGRRLQQGTSTIYDLFDGRSAATTIDRLMQKVSVSAGREKEGSYSSLLYTNLEEISSLSPVKGAKNSFTEVQAAEEAARCIQCECMECVKKCGFLQQYNGSPRRYVREVYNNLSIAMGNHDANGMINSCALCGQCEAICPNGLDLAQVFLVARQRMVNTGKMPQSAHEFALLDMEYSLSGQFYLAKHQPNKKMSKRIFFPGCQLAASEPALVEAVYEQLCEEGIETGLWLACCGIIAKWSGNLAKLAEVKIKLLEDWEKLGKPVVVAACPSCALTLRQEYGIETQFIGEALLSFSADRKSKNFPEKMRLHHACGARYDDETQNMVKKLATQAGIQLVTTGPEEESPCCGYGGLVPFVNKNTAEKVTQKALQQMDCFSQEGDMPYLTYCVNCRDRFLSAGKESMHLLEILFPQLKGLNRRNPTWSQRQDNRTNLRQQLLWKHWKEKTKRSRRMKLFMNDELADKMENIHILNSDIQSAIEQAEKENSKFADPKTGHYITQYRPANVSFWVEYFPENDGYRVFNAYSHRMTAVVTGRAENGGTADE